MAIPGQDASTTAAGAVETVNQPDYKALYETAQQVIEAAKKEAAEYKQRHSGLQGRYQQEQEKWTRDTDKLIQTEAQFKTVMGEKEALLLEKTQLAKAAADATAAASAATAQIERRKLIGQKFPELSPFEDEGLLPEGTGNDFAAKLAKFAEKLNGKGTQAVTDFRKGEQPPAPREVVAGTSAALFQQAYSASKNGKIDDYNRLYSQALALQSQGK